MPPPSAPQKPASPPTGGPAPAKKDKGDSKATLGIIGAALLVFGLGYMAFKIVTMPPEKVLKRPGAKH